MGNVLLGPRNIVSPRLRAMITILQVIFVLQILIVIAAFFFGDITHGIFGVIFLPILFCSWSQLQYTNLASYIISSIFLCIMSLAYVLGRYIVSDSGCRMEASSA